MAFFCKLALIYKKSAQKKVEVRESLWYEREDKLGFTQHNARTIVGSPQSVFREEHSILRRSSFRWFSKYAAFYTRKLRRTW